MHSAIEHAGAERGVLILDPGSEQRIAAEAMTGEEATRVDLKKRSEEATSIPRSILRYVARTHESVILDDASSQSPFSDDSYIRQRRARSILCLPAAHFDRNESHAIYATGHKVSLWLSLKIRGYQLFWELD